MKKKMALLLAAALTMTTILTGCGGGNEENADKQSDVTAEDAKEENASGFGFRGRNRLYRWI